MAPALTTATAVKLNHLMMLESENSGSVVTGFQDGKCLDKLTKR